MATFPEFTSANQVDPFLAMAMPRGPDIAEGGVTSVIFGETPVAKRVLIIAT